MTVGLVTIAGDAQRTVVGLDHDEYGVEHVVFDGRGGHPAARSSRVRVSGRRARRGVCADAGSSSAAHGHRSGNHAYVAGEGCPTAWSGYLRPSTADVRLPPGVFVDFSGVGAGVDHVQAGVVLVARPSRQNLATLRERRKRTPARRSSSACDGRQSSPTPRHVADGGPVCAARVVQFAAQGTPTIEEGVSTFRHTGISRGDQPDRAVDTPLVDVDVCVGVARAGTGVPGLEPHAEAVRRGGLEVRRRRPRAAGDQAQCPRSRAVRRCPSRRWCRRNQESPRRCRTTRGSRWLRRRGRRPPR